MTVYSPRNSPGGWERGDGGAAERARAQCGFLKLNAIFPVMLGLAHATVAFWCKSDVSASVVAAMPGDEAKVPLFVAAFMPLWSIILSIVALQALAAVAPNGYESQRGRAQKAPGEIERAGNPGWIERVQSAQDNNWESAREPAPKNRPRGGSRRRRGRRVDTPRRRRRGSDVGRGRRIPRRPSA